MSASACASALTTSSAAATQTPAAAKTDALQPRTVSVARNDLDVEDGSDGNNDDDDDKQEDDAVSLKVHLHRCEHTPSKLPAVRLNRQERSAASLLLSHPSNLQPAVPFSPVSPSPLPKQGPPTSSRAGEEVQEDDKAASKQYPQSHHYRLSVAADACSPQPSPRSRTSPTTATSNTATSPNDLEIPGKASCPEVNASEADQSSPLSRTDAARSQARRAPASRSSHGVPTTTGPPPSLSTQRRHAVEAPTPSDTPTAKGTPQGRRELLLPKRLPPDESRYSSSCRPPVSYKPPAKSGSALIGASAPVRVPPIRGFRSSGARRSSSLDMVFPSHPYDLGEDYPDTSNDQTLRALEGKHGDDILQMAGSLHARRRRSVADDTGDVFLRIAREEPARPFGGNSISEDAQSSVSRANRSSHRRPLSMAGAVYNPASPPRLGRRLSDQQDLPRQRILEDDQASDVLRVTTHRSSVREKPASVHPGEDAARTRAGGPTSRPSPLGPRSQAYQEHNPESSIYARRRASITDGSSTVAARSSAYSYKPSAGQHKAYSSSPLVRSFDLQNRQASELAPGAEGTESTASTTAPSTVWDELDDIKSRIHRLELTGKLPSTSGAAVSRTPDDRPATATTTGTTMSLSPKRQAAGPAAETANTTPSQREAHPLLHAALAKVKPCVSPEVHRALESAANDAIGLSAMMGTPGQPGPISSGASTIGSGSHITDRQLRKKAESVCRSLTELCVTLGEDAVNPRSVQPTQTSFPQLDGPATPTTFKSHTGLPAPRRASIATESSIPKSNSSPRALSKFEERRNHLLNGTALPSPRVSGSDTPAIGDSNIHRRSSLMIPRTRRVGIEEAEDGRNSSLLRTRRAGTEEPDEGRKTSLLVRTRRGTVGEGGEESRFRAPSRANTEINTIRSQGRDYAQEAQLSPSDGRRRLTTTSLYTSRLAAPSVPSPAPRRYLERSTPDRDTAANKLAEEYSLRPPALGQGTAHARATSLSERRQNRDSKVPAATPGVQR